MAKTKQIYKTILKTADKMHTIVKKKTIYQKFTKIEIRKTDYIEKETT